MDAFIRDPCRRGLMISRDRLTNKGLMMNMIIYCEKKTNNIT